jgi:hypothetical protein
MSFTIILPPEAETRLKLRAAAAGEDLPSYVSKLVAHFSEPPTPLEELSGPVYKNFLESGMTDDELGDAIEKAKHEQRTRLGCRLRLHHVCSGLD